MNVYGQASRWWFAGRLLALVVAGAAVVASGCVGSRGNSGQVSGSVKYKGQPVTGGTLTLHPADGKGAPTTVNITPAGTFVATGVSPGKMKVTVETESVKGMSGGYKVPKDMSKDNKVPQFDTSNMPVYVPIPKKYASAQTTPLTWDIGKGNNKQDFELTD